MNDYRALISDSLRFIKQNYAPGDSLLVPASAAAPPPPLPPTVQKRQSPEVVAPPLAPPKKIATPIAPPKKVEEAPHAPLHLQPLEAPLIEKADALKELLAKIAPDFALKESPPDDTAAVRIRNRWKEQSEATAVILLTFTESDKELQFYQNVARAIDLTLQPAKCLDGRRLEKEKKWDLFLESAQLKWILVSQDQLKKGMDILRHFRENPATAEKFLGHASLLLIPPPAAYFKEPSLKRTLWETLCTRLSS